MATTKVAAVIEAAVDAIRALPGYRDPDDTTTAGIPVHDGPAYEVAGDNEPVWLCIGWSGDDGGDESATSSQSTASLGGYQRDEAGTIACLVEARSGDGSQDAIRTVRTEALAVVADVEDLLRTSPTVGLSQAWMRWAEVGGRTTLAQDMAEGARIRVAFEINYRARI